MMGAITAECEEALVPTIVLLQHATPNVFPYYGKAQKVVDGDPKLTQCPESRVNEILWHYQRIQADLAKHRKYVQLLEADEAILRPFVEGESVENVDANR